MPARQAWVRVGPAARLPGACATSPPACGQAWLAIAGGKVTGRVAGLSTVRPRVATLTGSRVPLSGVLVSPNRLSNRLHPPAARGSSRAERRLRLVMDVIFSFSSVAESRNYPFGQ